MNNVTAAVLASDLPTPSKTIMLTLGAWCEGDPPRWRGTLSVIANSTSLSRSTVVKHLDALEHAGWLTRDRPTLAEARERQATRYTLAVGESPATTTLTTDEFAALPDRPPVIPGLLDREERVVVVAAEARRGGPVRRREPWWVTEPKVNRNPALKIDCPECGVPAGKPCIGRRPVHPARREKQYREQYPTHEKES